MQLVDDIWLTDRGDLHDATVLCVRSTGQTIEIDISDEWVNERGFPLPSGEISRPQGELAPGSLVLDNAFVVEGSLDDVNGGWVFKLTIDDATIRFTFCDRLPLVLQASAVNWISGCIVTKEA